ncbi:sensor histidine kinase [Oscillatoria salina]|uniref:sensor histidine kinase n=1 Tax=Oscillatoria salina TaxID=331517 RepID=UPI0013B5C54A|nr:sensor histidine kinase [Oscillatoria salina]MBZ8180859.1 sensor histidine kinase [Oscillatoria salina IIICB1]NET86927.1 sensor histidine kinase [Kamptonema sp. SIO1D9]
MSLSMKEIGQIINNNFEQIFAQWKKNVRQNEQINSSRKLSATALEDSFPEVLNAIISALDRDILVSENELDELNNASFKHGKVRAEQGFNAAEITREYRILRQTIFRVLSEELLKLTSEQLIYTFRVIDAVIDEASAQCFDHFVTERTEKLEQLQSEMTKTNEELKRMVQLDKNNFSQFTHELKTPLNSIMGYSQLLLRQQKSQENSEANQTIDMLNRVLRSSKQLLQLINDGLEILRHDAGNIQLQLIEVDVRTIVDRAVETILPLVTEKDLQLIVDGDRAPVTVTTDPSRLEQILTNLLSNAIRYTYSGTITVFCQASQDKTWTLTVADTGIGIAPEEQATIFEPFARTTAGANQDGSTGLGLAIVAQLVKLLQGEINLVSEVGNGSTFTLVFPLEITPSQS